VKLSVFKMGRKMSKEVRCPKRSVRCGRVFLQWHRPPPAPFIEDKITSRGQEEKARIKLYVLLRKCVEMP